MGGLDVIMTWDFYQVLPIWDSWIFQSQTNGLNSLGTFFLAWRHQTLWIKTNYVTNIINILNRFEIIFEDINFINRICLKALHTNNTLSHLFYTNTKTTTHNKRIFEKTIGETFKFIA